MFNQIAKNLAIGMIIFVSFSLLDAGETLTEVRAAYFYPTDSRFRDFYSNGGLYSIETSVQTCCKQLYPWASVGYFHKSGDAILNCPDIIAEGESTHITVVPIGFGLKYLFPIDCISYCNRISSYPYLGVGMLVSYVHIHNDSPYVTQRQSHWGIGGIMKAGFISDITHGLFLDLFVDYSYMKVNFHNHHTNIINYKANLSGLSIGGGIGYRF